MVVPTLHFASFHLTPTVDVLYRDGAAVPLEPQSVRVLRFLIENRTRVVSKDELLEKLWPDTFTTDDVLKKAISQARRALSDDANEPRFIRTWHGRGYQFIGTLDTAPVAAGPSAEKAAPKATIASQKNDPDFDQLLGRQAESQMLCAEYRNVLNGTGRPVLVAGEPGIGKTQLARHFSEWVKGQGGLCLYGRFFDYDGSRLAPYETFLDLLRSACGLAVSETRTEATALAAILDERFNVRLPAALLAEDNLSNARAWSMPNDAAAVDYHAPQGDAFQAIVPLGKAFVQLSRQQPLLLILDDLQWADESSREFIGWLMRNADNVPLFLLLLTRADEMADAAHPLHQWLKRQASYRSFTSLTLKPLDQKAFRQTIEAAFNGLTAPAAQVRELQQVTNGNPYFLTEMLRWLVAENVIQRRSDVQPAAWQWHTTASLRLPANLALAAEAKLDRLSNQVREIVEQAAVIGDEFRLETLAQMTQRGEEELEFLLEEALRRGVLSEHGVSAGEHFRFYHSILRRVLYERLAPRARTKAHLRAASAIEIVYQYESDRVADCISAHFEQGSDWQRAYEWSLRAWQAARQRWQWHDAATALERAARALGEMERRALPLPTAAEKLRSQLGLGECYASLGRFRPAETCLNETIAQATALQQPAIAAAAHRELSRTLFELSRYPESIEHARQARMLAQALPDPLSEALTLIVLCRTHAALGNFAEVERLSAAVFALAAQNVPLVAEMRGLLGWTLALQGRYEEALPLLTQALDHAQAQGDIRQQAHLRRRLHWVHLSRGNYETSFALAQAAREDFRSVGDASGEAKLSMALGQVRSAQGLFDEGLDYLQRTLQSLQEIGDRHCEAETYWLIGRTLGEKGQFEPGQELLARALTMVRELGDRDDEFRVLTDLARVSIGQHLFEHALESAQQAATIAKELGNHDGYGLAQAEAALALHGLGQTPNACTYAREAVTLLTASGSGELWRAQLALGTVTKHTDPATAKAALEATVRLLTAIHDQLSPDQSERRALIAHARPTATQMLCE